MRGLILLLCTFVLGLQLQAQVRTEHEPMAKQALKLFEASSFEQALPLYSQLVSLYPKDAELNYRFGTCALLGGEEKATAIKHLNFGARKNGPIEAWYYLGLAHHRNYDFKAAEEAYLTFQRKADEDLLELYPVERQMAMCTNGKGLLSSIVDVVVIDKKQSLAEEFFRYYNLQDIGGKILTTPEELKTKTDKKQGHDGVIHYPKGAQVVYFSSYGSNTKTGKDIYTATIVEGEFTNISLLEGPVNSAYDEDFPFMHPDGETLYFASKGHNSMGGYDIFMAKLDKLTGTWLPPVNLDFAINTPDDDLFYVADSLNQRAFFASARSSSQANLHVYEVMVGGLPVNLIFLKGTFTNQVPEGSRVAKIEIIDELTGRPVATVNTDPVTGEYMFSIPKSGLYKIKVEAESSVYTHQGQINLPIVESSVAFSQELKLVKETGQEKLIIDNFFDVPLDADIASLSREYLLQAAGLEVNATDERIAASQSTPVEEQAAMDTGAEPQWAAGFDRTLSLDDVLADAEEQAKGLDVRAQDLDQAATAARNLASHHSARARKAVSSAAAIWENADHSSRETYLESVAEYTAALKTAEDATHEAQAALEAAQGLEQFATDKRQEAKDVRSHSSEAKVAWEAGDFNASTEHLRWEKDRQNDTSDGEGNPAEDDRKKAYQLQQKQLEILEEVSAANQQIDKLNRDQARLEKELAEGPKKSRTKEITEELEAIASQLAPLAATLLEDRTEVTRLSAEELTLLRKAELFEGLAAGNAVMPEGFDPAATPNGDIAAELRNLERDLKALDRNDDVLLALASESTIKTRNDITTIPAIQARAEALGMTLALSGELREQVRPYLQDWEGEEDAYKRRTGIEMMQRTIAQQQRVLESISQDLQVQEDIDALALEQEALLELAGDLGSWMERLPVRPMQTINLDSYSAAELVIPTFRNQQELIRQQSESDLEQSIRMRALNAEAMQALENKLELSQQALVDSDDAMASAQLAEDIHQTKAALTALSANTEDIRGMQSAYESDHAAIVASDEIYRQKVEEQLALTQRYQEALEAARAERVSALEQSFSLEQEDAIGNAIVLLDAQIAHAQTKVDIYSADLERAVTTSEPPAEASTQLNPESNNPEDLVAEATDATLSGQEQEGPSNAGTQPETADNATGTSPETQTSPDTAADSNDATQNSGNLAGEETPNSGIESPSSLETENPETTSTGSENNPDTNLASGSSSESESTPNNATGSGSDTALEAETDTAAATSDAQPTATTTPPANSRDLEAASLTLDQTFDVASVVMPNFHTAVLDAQSTGETNTARDLLNSLLDQTQREIANQQGLLAALSDPILTNAIAKELSDLRALELQTLDYLDTLEVEGLEALDIPAHGATLASEIPTSGSGTPTADVQPETDGVPAVVFTPEVASALRYSEDERDYIANPAIDNANQVDALQQEVGALEMDFKAEPSERKRNRIAKEIQQVEARLAKEELKNHGMLTERSAEAYAANNTELDSLENTYSEQLDFVTSVQEAITRYRTKARFKVEDAANLRAQAENTKKDAERNALLNAALGLEVQAMKLQEDALRSFGQFNAASSPESPDSETTETESTNPDTPVATPEDSTPVFELPAIEVIPFEELETVDASEEWSNDLGLTEAEVARLEDRPELEAVVRAFEAVNQQTNQVNTLRQERSELQAEISTYATDLEADDLPIEERTRMLAAAEVVYNRLLETETALAKAETDLSRIQEQAQSDLVAANLEDVLSEIEASEAATLAASETNPGLESDPDASVDNPASAPELGAGDTPAEATAATTSPAAVTAPAVISIVAAEALLVMPLVLDRELFALVEAPIYNEDRRIPVNTARPSGIIYAVQVGAYRNSIPQDLFAEFAPIHGDELGNGITRYTAGLFLNFANANQAKSAIRGLGYGDAFVVAYRDGNRISLTEARQASGDAGPVAVASLPEATRTSVQDAVAEQTQAAQEVQQTAEAQEAFEQDPNYNYAPGAALAVPVESTTGVFYTVQVGVYSKPVSNTDLYGIEPLNTERLSNGTIRYTSGQFGNLAEASIRKDQIRGRGVNDAFVTAYINGKRVSVSEARQALGTGQTAPLQQTLPSAPVEPNGYEVIIGSFLDAIPAEAARAMLLLEGEYGIRQRQVGGRTEYFTEVVATRAQAEAIRDAFQAQGVSGVLIHAVQ